MRTIWLIITILSLSCKAQRIVDYNLFTGSNSVTGKFTLSAGSTCGGFTVQRSTDSLSFIQVYDYPNICGASGSPEPFSFTDKNPIVNQVNFYKIILNPYEIAVRKIYVGQSNRSTLIAYPNPIMQGNNNLNLKLLNAGSIYVFGYVYNQFGHQAQVLNANTRDDLMSINISGFENGVYLVWLTDGLTAYCTKFIVLN